MKNGNKTLIYYSNGALILQIVPLECINTRIVLSQFSNKIKWSIKRTILFYGLLIFYKHIIHIHTHTWLWILLVHSPLNFLHVYFFDHYYFLIFFPYIFCVHKRPNLYFCTVFCSPTRQVGNSSNSNHRETGIHTKLIAHRTKSTVNLTKASAFKNWYVIYLYLC